MKKNSIMNDHRINASSFSSNPNSKLASGSSKIMGKQ
jgi:hypothetical protein